MCYSGILEFTIRAETDSERKKALQIFEDMQLGNLLHGAQQPQKFVYTFPIFVQNEKIDELRHDLQQAGMHLLQINNQTGDKLWRNKKYTLPYQLGDLTVKEYKRVCKSAQ